MIKTYFKESFESWFNGSKVVDKNGKPLICYHGTPDSTFKNFKIFPAYFSTNKNIALMYKNTGASSIRGNKKENNPDVIEVYLKIEKPFDTRIPKIKKIFDEKFNFKSGEEWTSNGTPLSNKGLPDWTDGEDLYEFIKEEGLDFDGLILDEGGMGGYGDDVIDRGLSYVVFKPNQIKSINAKEFNSSDNIYESKQVGIIYHFTKIYNLDSILYRPPIVLTNYNRNYISFTRDYNFSRSAGGDFKFCVVRLVIDGNRLSNKYRISPFNFFAVDDDSKSVINIHKNAKARSGKDVESEERIMKNEVDITDSLIQIDILKDWEDICVKDSSDDFKNILDGYNEYDFDEQDMIDGFISDTKEKIELYSDEYDINIVQKWMPYKD
jgi:hypothetical protein